MAPIATPDQYGYYQGDAKGILRDSRHRMRFFYFTQQPFPTVEVSLEVSKENYYGACQDRYGSKYKQLAPPFTVGIRKLLRDESWSLRRRVKVVSQSLVDCLYGLHPSPEQLAHTNDPEERERAACNYTMNRVNYLLSTKNRYLCAPADTDDQLVPYTHIAIKKLIIDILFNPKSRPKPLCLVGLDEIDPIPIECIAYAGTGIRCALEEYRSGTRVEKEFSEVDFRDYYNKLLRSLSTWRENSAGYLRRLCHDIFTAGSARIRSDTAEDDRPDAPVILHDPPEYP
ncbi:hypothetical protein SCHPADRAFT_948141 [Schizopora paradoxa]|uniref:DUF6532 domain-containing protein n=1 Tax=Schizopora paradoxa TaxID=27342 RepID=A0A0H2QXA4_9AGAM|nr:hypothetical protein SCHPADRAFT_948141 [Schizopora paradoxa]